MEISSPAKEEKDLPKEIPTSEEQSSENATVVPQDWTGFQAYSPMPPHGYLPSGSQPPPYMWGVQHLMPHYGTAPHPYVMYPHGGLYVHPSMPPGPYPFSQYTMPSPNGVAEASVNTPVNMEVNGKPPEKEKLPIKRSGKKDGFSKAGVHANGSYPKSGESGSEGSSEGSDANFQVQAQARACLSSGETIAAVGSRENLQPPLWPQDERELKRQRRKLSNRESARRSRLRKQAECDELAQRAETLKEENASIKTEMSRIRSDYEQLLAENAALKERLGEAHGQEETKHELGCENYQNGQIELQQNG